MKPKSDAYVAAIYTLARLYIRSKGMTPDKRADELAQLNQTRRLLSGSGRTLPLRKDSR